MREDKRRLMRQIEMLERRVPFLRKPLGVLLRDGWGVARMLLAILFILGGALSFLPVLGLWMLPLGLMLLAVDVPPLRPVVVTSVVRGRRWISGRWRAVRSR